MTRERRFRHGRQPFQSDEKRDLGLSSSHINGPFYFLNPTRAHFSGDSTKLSERDALKASNSPAEDQLGKTENVKVLWRSRDNRKGRHALLVGPASDESKIALPRKTSHPKEVLTVIVRMFTYYPVWDISWCVAFIFTWGSIIWCINGFFSFLPLVRPGSEFSSEVLYGGGITAFIGAVVFFEIGSILLMLEAVNENTSGCFGWAVEEVFSEKESKQPYQLKPSMSHCVHHHQNRKNFVGKSSEKSEEHAGTANEQTKDGKTWQWFPSSQALKDHYLHELGFLASFSQLTGATIFSIAGFTALPGINNHLSQGLLDGIYWVPQVVGGAGFIISGTLYLLETQKNWYTPSFEVLGWHIAFWNLIGGIGFTLCGALGMAYRSSGAEYQASLSTFWGSFVSPSSSIDLVSALTSVMQAFLIGSVLQLYESLQKNPVEVLRS
jgi:hypothetical protein